MPRKSDRPTREDLIKAEKEIGENIPEQMVGLDDGDVRPNAADVAAHEPVDEAGDETGESRH